MQLIPLYYFLDDASLKALMDVIEGFEKISGLKINISKSECMGIGDAYSPPCQQIIEPWKRSTAFFTIFSGMERGTKSSEIL